MRSLILLVLLLGACTSINHTAEARLLPLGDSGVYGIVYFEEVSGGVQVRANINGLTGTHGFHIHEVGDCGNEGKFAGGHFDPHEVDHGAPEDMVRHVGDLGNIDSSGYDRVDEVIQLNGPRSIIGRAVVIHAQPDDFGQPTGNAGARIACGIIQ